MVALTGHRRGRLDDPIVAVCVVSASITAVMAS
jgi:hypothetical protein